MKADTTFDELPRLGLEVTITCQKCGRRRIIEGTEPELRGRRIVGKRFWCAECSGIGLPSIGKERRWTQKLAEHVRALKARTNAGG